MDSFQTPTNNTVDKCYLLTVVMLSHYNDDVCILCTVIKTLHIQGVTGGMDQTSGDCSLGQTIPI